MVVYRWLVLATVAARVYGGPVQQPDLSLPSSAATNKLAVVSLFNVSYEAYKSVSFLMDPLLALTFVTDNMHGVTMIYFLSRNRILIVGTGGVRPSPTPWAPWCASSLAILF